MVGGFFVFEGVGVVDGVCCVIGGVSGLCVGLV